MRAGYIWNICPHQIHMLQFPGLKVREEKEKFGDVFIWEVTEGYRCEIGGECNIVEGVDDGGFVCGQW